jgi:hypothetical protein
MVGSLFNSHLFGFTQGWGYFVGVGTASGIVLRESGTWSERVSPWVVWREINP